MSDPDIDLLVRVLAHDDRHAFGELVKRHQSSMRQYLRKLTKGDHARADDLAQDTFVKAYRSIRSFQGKGKFVSWLYRIAYTTFLNDTRRLRDDLVYEEAQAKTLPTDAQRSSDLSLDLEQALRLLKSDQAAVFHLHYKQGMSHAEIASCLQMPLGTVKTHLTRGLKVVREHLKDWKTP